jgi:hypothetical protein
MLSSQSSTRQRTAATRTFPVQLILALGLAAAAGLIIAVLLEMLVGPDAWPPTENPPRQCEAVLPASLLSEGRAIHSPEALARVVREPQNTWTSLFYVAAAALVSLRTRGRLLRGWLPASLVALGLGALLYHASATREWRHPDVAALFWVYLMLGVVATRRAPHISPKVGEWLERHAHVVGFATGLAAIALTYFRNVRLFGIKLLHVHVTTGTIITVISLVLLGVCLQRGERWRWAFTVSALLLVLAGVILQVADHPGGWLALPTAAIQPHAVWHLLSAASVVLAVEALEGVVRTNASAGSAREAAPQASVIQ